MAVILWVWGKHLKALTDRCFAWEMQKLGPSSDVSDRLLNKIKKNGDKIVASHLEKNGSASNQ